MKLVSYIPLLCCLAAANAFLFNLLDGIHLQRRNLLERSHSPVLAFGSLERRKLDVRAKNPPPPPDPPKYGETQTKGKAYIAYLDNPNDPKCPVKPSTTDFKQLQEEGWDLPKKPSGVPFNVIDMTNALGLESGQKYTSVEASIDGVDSDGDISKNIHFNTAGPRAIFALSNSRVDNRPWSEIAGAMYAEFGGGADLEFVFRVDVENEIAKPLITEEIYPQNGLDFPDETFRDWLPGSPEFAAILGTPNGKGVGALLLGHVAQLGRKKVSKITTWAGGREEKLQILFTLENA